MMGSPHYMLAIYNFVLFLTLLGNSLSASDYDEYSNEDQSNETEASENILCPRSIPGDIVFMENQTLLAISSSSREHLRSFITVMIIPSIYTIVFLVGLPSNALALWILATKVKRMTSTIFLMNLAAADLLLILVLPFKISYYFLGNNWIFGEVMCRSLTTFFYGNMYCSILLLMSISVDRYLAVVHPFFSRTFRSKTFAIGMCFTSWIIAILSTLPLATIRQSYPLAQTKLTVCHDVLPRQEQAEYLFYYFMCLIVMGFLLPLCIIVFCYASVIHALILSGDKYAYAVKLSALVLIIVIVFLTPSNLVLLLHYSEHCLHSYGDLYAVYMVCLAISSINSCVDPFVYYYVSEEFREKVIHQFRKSPRRSVTSLKTTKEVLPTSYSTSHTHSHSVL
ncbi:ase-activated receptor 4 [Pelobates cultripes]|uniref:Proteinase-activated receptor 4 n=1 Tax=Pelobates cultripes TaxID=61616 RepID=A0AAD1W8Z3_PELCU|nr:ase-activated receptor 4 [Pelobates cultripes]